MSETKKKSKLDKGTIGSIIGISFIVLLSGWSIYYLTNDGYKYHLNNFVNAQNCLDLALALHGGDQSMFNSLGLSAMWYSTEQKEKLVTAINEKLPLCESWQNVIDENGKPNANLATCEQISMIIGYTDNWFEEENMEKLYHQKGCGIK